MKHNLNHLIEWLGAIEENLQELDDENSEKITEILQYNLEWKEELQQRKDTWHNETWEGLDKLGIFHNSKDGHTYVRIDEVLGES